VDSLLWRSPAHHLRAEDGAGQRGAGLQVRPRNLHTKRGREEGGCGGGGVGDPYRREQSRKKEEMSNMSTDIISKAS
jgi:hypothetical protein